MTTKVVLNVGTRKKADYLIYLGYALHALGKRVLIVDVTKNGVYRNGYVRLGPSEYLYDLQGLDILVDVENWLDIEVLLKSARETTTNYDVILLDIDHIDTLKQDWPEFDDYVYVGDFERDHIKRDAELVQYLMSLTPAPHIRRITFGSKFKMNADFIEVLIKGEIKWNSIHMLFEHDDAMEELRLTIQHQQTIPFPNLNRQHKELINGYISELYLLHIEEVNSNVKQKSKGFLGTLFGKKNRNIKNDENENENADDYAFGKLK